MHPYLRSLTLLLLIGAQFVCVSSGEGSQEFRGFNAIPTPVSAEQKEADMAEQGYQLVSGTTALSSALMEKVVNDLFTSWNTPDLGSKLGKDLPNRSRILDAIQTGAPRYVRLRVLSIQNPRVVQQYVRPHPSGDGSYQLLSKISVRVYTEIAANTQIVKRFQRSEGTSEYLIQVTQKVRAA